MEIVKEKVFEKDNAIEKQKVNEIQEKIDMILRQTNYTEQEAKNNLKEFDNNPILVIENYLGINKSKKTSKPVISLNQEIYKQLRHKLDSSIADYNNKISNERVKLN
jgi:hypothetical protein